MKTRQTRVSPGRRLWRWVGTMRFALVLLILIALASIGAIACGEFLPVVGLEHPEAYYGNILSPVNFFLVNSMDLLHPYSSWWYLGLLSVLSLSLASCIASRLRSVLRESLGNEPLEGVHELPGLAIRGHGKAPSEVTPQDIRSRVREMGFRVSLEESQDGFQIAGTQRGLGRLGGILNHLGLLFLVVGGILVALMAERKMVWMVEGDEIKAPNDRYSVVLDSFKVEMSPEGEVSDYLSFVQIKENGLAQGRHTIQVNHPLRAQGWSWYQTTYQLITDRLRSVAVDVSDSAGTRLGHVLLCGNTPATIPNRPDVQLVMGSFYPHFQLKDGKPVSLSDELKNPAVQVHVVQKGLPPRDLWLFTEYPDYSHSGIADYQVHLSALEPLFATGLEVRSFPGAWAVWLGFACMTLGLCLSFGLNHERIWVFGHLGESGDWVLEAGAQSMHGEATLKRRFSRLMCVLEHSGNPVPSRELEISA